MDGLTPNHCRLSRGSILDSVYACLKRLQINRFDLLYFHAFDPFPPIEESLAAIEDLVRQDLVRYFEVTNFTVENLTAYQAVQSDISVPGGSFRYKINSTFCMLRGRHIMECWIMPDKWE
jgi:1-deoxyxylulose-5-phosphate synthase